MYTSYFTDPRRARRYGLAMERAGFEFLFDPHLFYGPPRVLVRRGHRTVLVWLDPDDVHVCGVSRFAPPEERRILALVEAHADELTERWFDMRNDAKRGRLDRNPMVD